MTEKSGYIVDHIKKLSPAHRALWVLVVGHSFALAAASWMVAPKMIVAIGLPVIDPWTPAILRSPIVYGLAVLGPSAFGIYTAFRPASGSLRLWAWWCFLGGAVGLVHQMTLGWAEVLLMFWTGAWALWLGYVGRGVRWGPRCSTVLLGLMFAYPAIGKYTPGYWSGELYWELHWRHGGGVPGWLAEILGESAVRPWVRVYGPVSIIVESALGLVWLLPVRVALAVVLIAAVGILVGGGLGFMCAMGFIASTVMSAAALVDKDRFDALIRES